MGFVRIFWKNNVQEAYLPKMSISGQIVSEIVAQLYSENSMQTLLIFFLTCPGYLETHYALSRVGLWKLQHFSQQRKVLRRISALWKILLK